jgi:hypothetical protein
MNEQERLHKLALQHGLKPQHCERCHTVMGYLSGPPEKHLLCDPCNEKEMTTPDPRTLGEDQMMCPRCKDPVDVNPTDLTWSCPACSYNYKEFDMDLEDGADLDTEDEGDSDE